MVSHQSRCPVLGAGPAGGPRSGASEVTLLVVGFLALLVVAAVILFGVLEFDTDPAGKAVAPDPATSADVAHAHGTQPRGPVTSDGTRQNLDAAGQPVDGLRIGPGIEVGEDLAYRSAPKLFDGIGRITGNLEAPAGQPFPSSWNLVVEPSLFVAGRENAAPRQVLTFPGEQRDFAVEDLPLGAYRIFAEAENMDCPAHEVLLFAVPDQPPAAVQMHKHVLMRFHAARGTQGVVLNAADLPVADLPVLLVPTASTPNGGADAEGSAVQNEPIETLTNGNGEWAFAKTRAGTYKLYLGSRQRPLIEAETLQVEPAGGGRPPLNHTSRVPHTQTLYVVVMDTMGRGLPGARVRGIGASPIDLETDSTGVATAKFLLPGPYRLMAEHVQLALSGKGRFEVETDVPPPSFTIICRP